MVRVTEPKINRLLNVLQEAMTRDVELLENWDLEEESTSAKVVVQKNKEQVSSQLDYSSRQLDHSGSSSQQLDSDQAEVERQKSIRRALTRLRKKAQSQERVNSDLAQCPEKLLQIMTKTLFDMIGSDYHGENTSSCSTGRCPKTSARTASANDYGYGIYPFPSCSCHLLLECSIFY